MGLGNPTPLWGARKVHVVGQQSLAGRNHLKMKITDGTTTVEAIAFGQAGRRLPSGDMDIAFQIQIGNSLSRRTVQLNIKDFREAEE
jgi:single-stranded DNA-specific DHH superfamily exonuclease